MGMDYRYNGSASYPRFNNEVSEIAKLFGGKSKLCGKPKFEFDEYKYEFKEGTPEILQRWFNDIWGDFTLSETKEIWEEIKKYPEIEDISPQIWNELQDLVAYGDNWHVF